MLTAIIIYLIIGAFAGIMAGLLGVGGGLVVVPCLVYIFASQHVFPDNLVMHVVTGTSLAAMISTTLFSLRAHYHRGAEFWPVFKLLLGGMIVGVITGTILAKYLYSKDLMLLFGLFVLVISIHMFLPSKQEEATQTQQLPGVAGRWSAAILIGISSGLLGIGGSTLCIPFLTYCKVPIRNAMAVSTAGGLMIAIIGTVTFILTGWGEPGLPAWTTGFIYWPAAIAIGLSSPWFATLGAALSHKLPVKVLKRLFAVFLLIVALQMLLK